MDNTTKWLLGLAGVAALGGVGYLAWRHLRTPEGAAPEADSGKPTGERIPGKTQAAVTTAKSPPAAPSFAPTDGSPSMTASELFAGLQVA